MASKVLRLILITISITVCKTTRSQYSSNGGIESAQHNSGLMYKFSGEGMIPAAIQTRRNIEVRQVNLPSDPIQPATVLVDTRVIPLTILFRSVSSALNVMQEHIPGQVTPQQHSKSGDEPHQLIHHVTKPIIQEVRELITPFRRVIQEVQPVQQDIHTIVAKGQQIAPGVNKNSGNRNNNGANSPGSRIDIKNVESKLNSLSDNAHFKVDNKQHFVKFSSPKNFGSRENSPSSFDETSTPSLPVVKPTDLKSDNLTNSSKMFLFANISHPSNHRSINSSVRTQKSLQNENKFQNIRNKTDVNPITNANNSIPIEPLRKPLEIEDEPEHFEVMSEINRIPNKPNEPKKLASPAQILRSKLAHKKLQRN